MRPYPAAHPHQPLIRKYPSPPSGLWILLASLPTHKMLLQSVMTKISVWGGFFRQSMKSRKSWPNVFKIQSMSILAIRGDRRKETISMPRYSLKLQNWTILSGIQLMRKTFQLFKDIANSVTYSLNLRMSFAAIWLPGSVLDQKIELV